MLHPTSARGPLAKIAKAAGLLLLACPACASAPLRPDLSAQQACVEDALRRRPDPTLATEAAPALKQRCAAGDLPSCSMLGVAHELGIGVRADRVRALALYIRACDGGNMRACSNQGELMLALGHPVVPEGALRLLHLACDAGQARGCAALGRVFIDGRLGVPRAGAPLLTRACELGEPSACVDLAGLVERDLAPGGSRRVLELLAVACAAGEASACTRVDDARPGPLGPARVVVAGAGRR